MMLAPALPGTSSCKNTVSMRSVRQLALPLLRRAVRPGVSLKANPGDASTGSYAAAQGPTMMVQATQHQAAASMSGLQQQSPPNSARRPVVQQQPMQASPGPMHQQQQQQQQQYQQQPPWQQAQQPYQQPAQQQAYGAEAPADEAAGPEETGPDTCDYEEHCLNAIALTGRVLRPPTFMEFPSGQCKTDLRIMAFGKTMRRPWPIRVEAWDTVAQNLKRYVSEGAIVCLNGRLAPPYKNSGYKVVVEEFWAVEQSTIPQEALDSMEQAISSYSEVPERDTGAGTGTRAGVMALAPATVWKRYVEDGADMTGIAQEHNLAVSTIHEKLMQSARDNWQTDWQRICSEVGLDTGAGGVPVQQLAAVMEAAHTANPTAVSKAGEPLRKVARDAVLADPALGPLVAAQEQQGQDGVSRTYMQLTTINVMKKLGVDLSTLAPAP